MFYNNQMCGCGCRNRTLTLNIMLKPQTTSITPCSTTIVSEKNCTNCGVTLALSSTPCCARVCETITYTLTITNNSSQELGCPTLNIILGDSLCYICGTLTIDGTANDATCLRGITLDTIAAGAIVTITLEARVMTNERYVNSLAYLDYGACCCLDNRCYRTTSNIDQIQVCQCCGN